MYFSAAWRTTGAGSTTLPIGSVFSAAAGRWRLREVGCFNTTATAAVMVLRRATAVGTPGAGQSELCHDDETVAAAQTAFDTHTVAPTLTGGQFRVWSLAAAIGAGSIYTFGGNGIEVPAGTANGLVIVPLTGTGQICDVYFGWEI